MLFIGANPAKMTGGRAPAQFTVDPREVINLFHRCVRCLCLRVRENDVRRVATPASEAAEKFYALAAKWMTKKQSAKPWLEVGGQQFRIASQGRRVLSEPIPYPDVNVELSFSARSDAVLELKDGSSALVSYQIAVPVERRQRHRDLELEAEAFAVENPVEKDSAMRVDRVGSLEFLVTGAQGSSVGTVLGMSRLTLIDRLPEERDAKPLKDFMRVVAGILAARIAPPANPYCEFCKRSESAK